MPINRVVIVGDGLAAWLTASVLGRVLTGATATVHVVPVAIEMADDDDSLGVPVRAESSLPSMKQFFRFAGLDEKVLTAAAQGGFSLGSAVSNWVPDNVTFNPFGEVGAPLGPVNFLHVVLRMRNEGQQIKLANFSLAALCAQTGRFRLPADDDRSVLSTLEYGMQFELAAYTEWLKKDAIAHGVVHASSRFQRLQFNESGYITDAVSEDAQKIPGDLFIDCSGPSRHLASCLPDGQFTDWRRWLPCDRVSNSIVPTSDMPQPYVLLSAIQQGWVRSIGLPGRRAEQRFISSVYSRDEERPAHAFSVGCDLTPWRKNCVALGGASVVIDPVSSLQLHMLHSGIERLVALFPAAADCMQESIEFNRQFNAEVECARDYAIAHYKFNGRNGEPFWDECRNMPVPYSLAHRVAVYQSSGRIVMQDGEIADRMNWAALFDAHNLVPAAYDVVARGLPQRLMKEHLDSIRQTLLNAVGSLPAYQVYLNQVFNQ